MPISSVCAALGCCRHRLLVIRWVCWRRYDDVQTNLVRIQDVQRVCILPRGSMGRTIRFSVAHCSSALGRDFFHHRHCITGERSLCEIEENMCLGSFIAVLDVAQAGPLRLLLFLPSLILAFSALPLSLSAWAGFWRIDRLSPLLFGAISKQLHY